MARTYTEAYQSVYGAAVTWGRRKTRLHALIQRNRYAAKLVHRMTDGLLWRTVDGTKAVLAVGC